MLLQLILFAILLGSLFFLSQKISGFVLAKVEKWTLETSKVYWWKIFDGINQGMN